MTIPMGIAVYFTMWWIVLFAVLPFGVRSHDEHGSTLQGTDPGAPVATHMAVKAFWTTLISALLFAALLYYMSL